MKKTKACEKTFIIYVCDQRIGARKNLLAGKLLTNVNLRNVLGKTFNFVT